MICAEHKELWKQVREIQRRLKRERDRLNRHSSGNAKRLKEIDSFIYTVQLYLMQIEMGLQYSKPSECQVCKHKAVGAEVAKMHRWHVNNGDPQWILDEFVLGYAWLAQR